MPVFGTPGHDAPYFLAIHDHTPPSFTKPFNLYRDVAFLSL